MIKTKRTTVMCRTGALCLMLSALALGCQGELELIPGDGPGGVINPHNRAENSANNMPVIGDPDPSTDACQGASTATADVPARVLTSEELNNALAQMFPSLELEHEPMLYDSRVGTFVLNSREAVVATHIRDFRVMAERISQVVAANIDEVAPCDGDAEAQRICTEAWVADFTKQAFRRPADTATHSGLMGLYDAGFEVGGHAEGVRWVTEATLQAPSFIYVHEAVAGGDHSLDGYEIAQRMAALTWRSLPDDELIRAAEAGELADAAQREAQLERMLNDARGAQAMRSLLMQWFGLDQLPQQAFAQQEENAALVRSMEAESERLIDHILSTDGSYTELLTAPYTFVDQTLADHYDIDVTGADEVSTGVWRVTPTDRAGLLTHAGFLALHHGPVHRGLTLRKGVLCGEVPGPVGIDIESIPTEEGESERSKSQKRLDHTTCGGCHRQMDTLGLGFDTFDELGRSRVEDDYGNLVTATGEVYSTRDSNGTFDGATELVERLAASTDAKECASRQLFVWTYGRTPTTQDACMIQTIREALVDEDDLRVALKTIVTDERFVSRTTGSEQ